MAKILMTLAIIQACLFGMMRCNQERPPNTSNSFSVGRPLTSTHCSGSLQMAHIHRYRGDDRQQYVLRRPYKPRLQFELLGRTVIQIWTTGQCCWRVYEGFRFRGSSLLVGYGDTVNTPTFTPKSARKTRC